MRQKTFGSKARVGTGCLPSCRADVFPTGLMHCTDPLHAQSAVAEWEKPIILSSPPVKSLAGSWCGARLSLLTLYSHASPWSGGTWQSSTWQRQQSTAELQQPRRPCILKWICSANCSQVLPPSTCKLLSLIGWQLLPAAWVLAALEVVGRWEQQLVAWLSFSPFPQFHCHFLLS